MAKPNHSEPKSEDDNPLGRSMDGECIGRLPVQQSVSLGSIYDARTDCIVGNILLPIDFIGKSVKHKSAYCKVFKDSLIDVENLLDDIGIEDDLWLSLVFNMVSAEGITSLINAIFSVNKQTRILHYCYVREQKYITDNVIKLREKIRQTTADTETTHLVAAITSGIHVIVLLQLSTDNENEMDNFLEKISQDLRKKTFKISKEEKEFNQLTVRKVFSNFQDLNQSVTLFDLCQQIVDMKKLRDSHHPVQCFLRPIHWFYPSQVKNKATYVPLDQDDIKNLKQYLFPLWFKMKQLNELIIWEIKESFSEHLKTQFSEIQQEITKVKEDYSAEINRIRDKILEFRSGKLKEKLTPDILMNTTKILLENKIDDRLKRIRSLKAKAKFINDLNQQNIKYFNMEDVSIQQNDDINSILRMVIKFGKEELIFCSTDDLRDQNQSIWNEYYNNGIGKHETNSSLDLIYADFSYMSSFNLLEIKVFEINQTNDIEKRVDPSFIPTLSRKETIQSFNKQSGETKESLYLPSLVNLSNIKIRSSQEEKTIHIDTSPRTSHSPTQSRSEDLSTPNEESENIQTISYKSIVKSKYLPTDPSDNVGKVTLPISSSSLVTEPLPQKKTQLTDMKSPSDSHELSNISSEEDFKSSTELNNHNEEEFKIPNPLTKSILHTTSPTELEPINSEVSVSSSSALTSSMIMACMSRLKNHSNSEDHNINVSTSVLLSISEASQQTGDHNDNTKGRIAQTKPSEKLTVEYTSLPLTENEQSSVQEQNNKENSLTQSNSADISKNIRYPDSSGPVTEKYINVLLLGESGVGKSTFTNALVNYITFESFQMARSAKPVVVMPVSFMMTVGDQFDEKIITFGDEDFNEDHYHPGQSVTQHCRSYVFPIGTRTKIRIIDTPGMGDTCDLTQDDLNLQHIISFISNLPHLNAICILLKPNESRLNIILRSYFDRLLKFLGENARHNIIFCFTNTRATFFAPGNTALLLKEMISSCPIKEIPFRKSNTFCFDSESFRFLVALQNGIKFDEYQENEYQQSWSSSVTESDRLLRFVCDQELKPYFQNEWRSIEHAQFKISQMTRPMLETSRNIFRNIISLERNPIDRLIKLCPVALSDASAICYTCKLTRERLNDFWILQDDSHVFSDQSNHCNCGRKKHVVINYHLQYILSDETIIESFQSMKSTLKQLKATIINFARFYAKIRNESSQTDPILPALKRMIAEEKELCSQNDSTCLNPFLYGLLCNFKKECKLVQKTSISNDISIDLSDIYAKIHKIFEIDEIQEQMILIRQNQESFIKKYEKQLS